ASSRSSAGRCRMPSGGAWEPSPGSLEDCPWCAGRGARGPGEVDGEADPRGDALLAAPAGVESHAPSRIDRCGVEGCVSARVMDDDAVDGALRRYAQREERLAFDAFVPEFDGELDRGALLEERGRVERLLGAARREGQREEQGGSQVLHHESFVAPPAASALSSASRLSACRGVSCSTWSSRSRLRTGGSGAWKRESWSFGLADAGR